MRTRSKNLAVIPRHVWYKKTHQITRRTQTPQQNMEVTASFFRASALIRRIMNSSKQNRIEQNRTLSSMYWKNEIQLCSSSRCQVNNYKKHNYKVRSQNTQTLKIKKIFHFRMTMSQSTSQNQQRKGIAETRSRSQNGPVRFQIFSKYH